MREQDPHDFVFYAPLLRRNVRDLTIEGGEHRHLSRVLRMSRGESVYATNGSGLIARCSIEDVGPDASRLRVDAVVEDRTSEERLVLALACLKKDAFEQAVTQCTELGITRFVPFVAAASHVAEYSRSYLERLRRIALSAMKQSFRAVLPKVDEPISFALLVESARDFPSVVVGDAAASPLPARTRPRPILIVVGPEGGLSGKERDLLAGAGGEAASVSKHRLRAQTAAAMLAGFLA